MVRRGKKRKVVVKQVGAFYEARYGNREYKILRGGTGSDWYALRKYKISQVDKKTGKVRTDYKYQSVTPPCKTIDDVKEAIRNAS